MSWGGAPLIWKLLSRFRIYSDLTIWGMGIIGLQYPLLLCISSAFTVRPVACPRLVVKPSWSRCIPLILQLPYQVISLSNEILVKLVGSSFL